MLPTLLKIFALHLGISLLKMPPVDKSNPCEEIHSKSSNERVDTLFCDTIEIVFNL